jgi:hypothetical protein
MQAVPVAVRFQAGAQRGGSLRRRPEKAWPACRRHRQARQQLVGDEGEHQQHRHEDLEVENGSGI